MSCKPVFVQGGRNVVVDWESRGGLTDGIREFARVLGL